MSKAIASYPEHMRQMVIDRRVRQYNPKGPNGCGVLAAMDYMTKRLGKKPPQVNLSDGRNVDDIPEPIGFDSEPAPFEKIKHKVLAR